jgi:6-phosphogluconolactonase
MPNINESHVSIFDTPNELALAAAQRFADESAKALTARAFFAVALAGGETPRRIYETIAAQFTSTIAWRGVYLFFGDERCVPPDHHDSNYLMAYTSLISKVPIPRANVVRIKGELGPTEGATLYEADLRDMFRTIPWPRFDLIYLGLGTDGHTASLFPGSDVLNEKNKWVGTSTSGNHSDRITLTIPVINFAAHVVFLVSGKEKAARLREVLRKPASTLPASLIKPTDGLLEWLVDKEAASLL